MINALKELKYDNEKLEEAYFEALKDSKFKNFVEKIKLDSKQLQKYTSSLEDSCVEFNNCLDCQSINCCQNKLIGYAYLPKVQDQILTFHYKPCRYKKKQDEKYSHLKNITYYHLPNFYQEASFKDIEKFPSRKNVLLWINNFIKNPKSKGLYLSGNFGCGKTYMIVAVLNELAKKNLRSAIVFWPEFLRDLKTSFNTNYEEKMEYIKRVPVLLIDDIGSEVITSWARDEILCPILQYRMDLGLTTFFTSNLSIDNLEQHLSQTKDGVELIKAKRITERIKFLTDEMELIGKNMRK